MKVALLGAPGSGKTAIAKRLARRLNTEPLWHWAVIDGYIDRLAKKVNAPFGPHVSFPVQIAAISERWKTEWEAEAKGHNTITCGSIYESIIYAGSQTIKSFTEDQLLENQAYAEAIMRSIGVMERMTFDYDALFYLPLQDRSEEELHSWEGVVDAQLPDVLSSFGKYAVTLNGTDKGRTDTALEIIGGIVNITAATETERSTI